MKALSMTQPWATLVMIGAKQIETRSWPTNYRGPLLIHAAKALPRRGIVDDWSAFAQPAFRDALMPLVGCDTRGFLRIDLLPRGVILGTVVLEHCAAIGGPPPDEPERSFGDYSFGRYRWFLWDPRPLAEPIPWRGRQRIFNVPDDVMEDR